jgi:acyl carrier protein phosphodiesterase
MVTTDISQLTSECNVWITNLRNYREEFNKLKTTLQEVASRKTSKNALQDIEHYQNQFQIQLFNIHDLKLAIKEHERVAGTELADKKGISDKVWSKHETLYESYHQLDQTLQDLKEDFKQFAESNH